MRMSFGKHKDEELNTLPKSYIEWLYNNVTLKEDLKEEILKIRSKPDYIQWLYLGYEELEDWET